ncbi:helix-turn-helix domain-containing protein [Spirillospora albida]|uniref:helix-turn-helix domain-containing protein n=1 Tax=Spirillospora albida TaxID=58123 RepID=UPI0004BFADED|nr:helix-turn-helix domain-containing protein [Spirillospora albida]
MHGSAAWGPVTELIERVVADPDVLASAVSGVRSTVPGISALPPADVAGHTRALLVAATRALADRRGPTEAELSFVQELAITRARQGIPIEAVLGAIHVAERAIWSRARELAGAEGVDPGRLLDARELYDDWADAVRERLITAHRDAGLDRDPRPGGRDQAILRRLLEGGSAAALAAAEAGLPSSGGLRVLAARPAMAVALERTLRDQPPVVVAVVDDLLIGVLARPPAARVTGGDVPAGLAGPAGPEDLATARRLAVAALAAAESAGRTGVVHIAEVAALAAMAERADLSAALFDHHREAWEALGPGAAPLAHAVRAWLEGDRDYASAAARLFVHPNTVRNRVQRFTDVTGIDPMGTFGAVDAWWLCRAWQAREPG